MDFNIDSGSEVRKTRPKSSASGSCSGWLLTSVSSWGETKEDAFDQCLVDLGLGDSRIVRMTGAMLPMGFEAISPDDLPLGSLVECHLAEAYAEDGDTASAGVAWAQCETPEGDECAIVATISSTAGYEECELLLKRTLKRKLTSRDLEVTSFDTAVDEVTAGEGHHGCAIAALILPDTLKMQTVEVGRVRGGLTRSATDSSPSHGVTKRAAQRGSQGDFSFQL